jgi:hypothetical protein
VPDAAYACMGLGSFEVVASPKFQLYVVVQFVNLGTGAANFIAHKNWVASVIASVTPFTFEQSSIVNEFE